MAFCLVPTTFILSSYCEDKKSFTSKDIGFVLRLR